MYSGGVVQKDSGVNEERYICKKNYVKSLSPFRLIQVSEMTKELLDTFQFSIFTWFDLSQ